jgi:hypothetical protein
LDDRDDIVDWGESLETLVVEDVFEIVQGAFEVAAQCMVVDHCYVADRLSDIHQSHKFSPGGHELLQTAFLPDGPPAEHGLVVHHWESKDVLDLRDPFGSQKFGIAGLNQLRRSRVCYARFVAFGTKQRRHDWLLQILSHG